MVLFFSLMTATVVSRSFDPAAFNHDVGWVLYVAEQMLDGDRIYSDIVEENPPLIFWISQPSVLLGQAFGTSPILVFNLMVLAGAALAGALLYRVLCRGRPEASGVWALSVVGFVIGFEILAPGYEFGQRENLFLIAVMPYLFGAAVRADGRQLGKKLAVLVGLVAGMGLAIKPYFLLFWVVVEIVLFFSDRQAWKRTENLCIVGVQALYVFMVIGLTPGYLKMIEIASTVYDSYGAPGSPMLLLHSSVAWYLVAAGLFVLVRPLAFDRQPRRFLLAGSLGFLAVALVQGKGWDYHYDPLTAASGVLIAVILQGFAMRADSLAKVLRFGSAGLFLAIWLLLDVAGASALVQSSWNVVGPGRLQRTFVGDLTEVVKDHAWRQPVWFLSTSIVPAFPVVNLSEAQWSSRFCCLWLLPGLYSPQERASTPFAYREREEMGELERYLVDAVVEDLKSKPPTLLFVDQSPDRQGFGRSQIDYLEYFLRDPRFASLFENYRNLGEVGPYRVYKRKRLGE
jgi:hypothetical protein